VDRVRGVNKTFYSITPPGSIPLGLKALVSAQQVNLAVCHESSVLYVYAGDDLTDLFGDIDQAVIAPYVLQNGGTPFDEPPHRHIPDTSLLNFWDDLHSKFVKSLKEGTVSDPTSLQPLPEADVKIHLDAEPERAQIVSEEVSVPPGVTIKVKRSRTIEHTVDVSWTVSGGASIDAGFRPIIRASIQGGIEQERGRAFQESETIEYEVELSGQTCTRYKLVWTDVWRKGFAEFHQGGTTQILPFRFREWAELAVLPVDNKRVT
jgi:hypothetical protein